MTEEKREKVIRGLEEVQHYVKVENLPAHTLKAKLVIDDAIALLKAQEPMTVNERRDLEILRRVKSGKILKHGCADYVIYNGEWYRKNPWNHPQEPMKPEMIMYTGAGIGISNCPQCGCKIDEYHNDKFCGSCGQAVRWK